MRPLIIANWKANLAPGEEVALATDTLAALRALGVTVLNGSDAPQLSLAPSSAGLVAVASLIQRTALELQIGITAQDCSAAGTGPHTGELPAAHLVGIASAVLVGHSERRATGDGIKGEGDALIGKKLAQVAAAGLRPILCVGDAQASATLEDRVARVLEQCNGAFASAALVGWSAARLLEAGLVIAYEPIWAIGSGTPATPEDARAVALGLRNGLHAPKLPVLYGGSVDAQNAGEWFADVATASHLDGLLVGGASLNASKLVAIVEAVATRRRGVV
jgi:triosephosphate isomerase